MQLKNIKNHALALFFPNRCVYCGKVILPEEKLCEDCKTELPVIANPTCSFCGASKEDCACKKQRFYFERIVAPFYYENQIETAVHRLKFQDKPYLAKTYAKDIAKAIQAQEDFPKIDVITFIPFTKKQKRERAYNPSALLAEYLSEELTIPMEPLLFKMYETKTQHILPGEARSGNVLGAYEVLETAQVENKTILLVDDIKTTGATLNECAKMLMLKNAATVIAATFAITKPKRKK